MEEFAMSQTAQQILISADSHVVEPADVWSARLGERFGDRVPHVVSNLKGMEGDYYVGEGLDPVPVALFGVAGEAPEGLMEAVKGGFAAVPKGGGDPVRRLEDMDRDGVQAEFIYPSFGMMLFGLKDVALRVACFQAYNDWIAEFCNHAPPRLAGAGMIPVDDVDVACEELKRISRLGLRGGMISCAPGTGRTYDKRLWDPMWATAAELGLPLSLHIVTEEERTGERIGPEEGAMKDWPLQFLSGMRSFNDIVFGGALERHPELKIVLAEQDVGWVAHFLHRMDHAWEKQRFATKGYVIKETPSFYFKRQVKCTFQDDPVGVANRYFTGIDSLMWASDYPHGDSTWPHSREVIAKEFAGVPQNEIHKIVYDNCRTLYNF
jgi:predicted TIM-barrel fold metal-dependent hydrolase